MKTAQRLAIRGFADGKLIFEERLELDEPGLEKLLPGLAEKHATALVQHRLHMIDVEFLDEPTEDERFFRFGTDPAGMVIPIALDLG